MRITILCERRAGCPGGPARAMGRGQSAVPGASPASARRSIQVSGIVAVAPSATTASATLTPAWSLTSP